MCILKNKTLYTLTVEDCRVNLLAAWRYLYIGLLKLFIVQFVQYTLCYLKSFHII